MRSEHAGLACYDGWEWKRYRAGAGSIASNDISGVFEASDGRLWVTTSQGLSRFDPERDTWSKVATPTRVYALTQDRSGQFWALSPEGKPLRLNLNGSSAVVATPAAGDELSQHPHAVHSMMFAQDGSVWMSCIAQGVCRRRQNGEWEQFTKQNSGLTSNNRAAFREASDGTIWAYLPGARALNSYNPRTGAWSAFSQTGLSGVAGLPVEDRRRSINYLALREGVAVYDAAMRQRLALLTTHTSALSSSAVISLLPREDGTVWFGFANGNLDVFEPWNCQSTRSEAHGTQHAYSAEGVAWRISSDGLYVHDLATNHWRKLPGVGWPWGGGPAPELLVTRKGDLVGATNSLAARFDLAQQRWEVIRRFQPPTDEVWKILELADGRLWFQLQDRVELYDPVSRLWSSMDSPSERRSQVNAIIQSARDESIWLAAYGDGIWRYDLRSGQWQHVTRENSELNNNAFNAVAERPDGSLWFASDRGVFIHEEGRWRKIEGKAPIYALPSDHTNGIGFTPDGKTWCATKAGLSLFDGETWSELGGREGLPRDYLSGLQQVADGSLWVEAGPYLTRFRPANYAPRTFVRYQNLLVGNRNGTATGYRVVSEREEQRTSFSVMIVGQALLPVERRGALPTVTTDWLTVDLFALNQWRNDPQDEFWFSYQLDGGAWSSYQRGPELTLRELRNGTHKLRARAKNRWLNVDSLPVTFHFAVALSTPAWIVRTLQAAVVALIITVMLGAVIYRQRVLHIAALNAANARVKQALGTLTSLEQKVVTTERLAIIGQMTSGIAHEIGNPLASVMMWAQHIVSQASNAEAVREAATVITHEARRLSHLLDEIRHHSNAREYTMEVAPLGNLVHEVCVLMRQDLLVRTMTLEEVVEGNPRAAIHLDKMKQVLINLIRNGAQAIGGRPGGRLMVCALESDTHALIRVEDNGVGMPSEQLDNIWGAFFTTKGAEGTGLGLSISRQIVERHGGTIEVKSREGQGTTFTIRLPKA